MQLRTTVFPATWEAQQRAGEVAGVVDEAVTGVRIVKGFGAEDREIERLATASTALYRSRVRLVRLQARATSTLAAIPAFAQVAVLALGGWLAMRGHLSLGTFLAFSTYLVQLVAPIRMMALVVAALQQARAGATRVLEILDVNADIIDRPDARRVDPTLTGDVSFDNVTLRLHRAPSRRSTDSRLHVERRRGGCTRRRKRLGQVDRDRTAAPLLRRGVPERFASTVSTFATSRWRRCATRSAWSSRRRSCSRTRCARTSRTAVRTQRDEQVRTAAQVAGAEVFIDALPDGFDTVVGERGLTLCGGQRQRIALARAVVSNPRILVLDDATSAVDTTTEEAIHAALRAVMAGAHHDPRRASRLHRAAGRSRGGARQRTRGRRRPPRRPARAQALATARCSATRPARCCTTTSYPPTVSPWRHGPTGLVRETAVAQFDLRGSRPATGAPGGGNFGANLAATPELLAAVGTSSSRRRRSARRCRGGRGRTARAVPRAALRAPVATLAGTRFVPRGHRRTAHRARPGAHPARHRRGASRGTTPACCG